MGNDMTLIGVIVGVLALVGLGLPFVQSAFDIDQTSYNIDSVTEGINPDDQDGGVGIFDILKSVGKMFFWTFGGLPVWLDLFFVVLRLILIITIFRNLWVGGGS